MPLAGRGHTVGEVTGRHPGEDQGWVTRAWTKISRVRHLPENRRKNAVKQDGTKTSEAASKLIHQKNDFNVMFKKKKK